MQIAKKLPSNQQRKDPFWIIVLSVVIASVLVVYPLNYSVTAWRPLFMLLVVLFWSLCQPNWCGVWFAFGMGLYTDLLLDAPLGLNALSYVLIVFIARYFIREKRILTFINLWVIVLIACLAHMLFIHIAQVMGGIPFSITRHWMPLLSSVLFWPILYYLLKRWRI